MKAFFAARRLVVVFGAAAAVVLRDGLFLGGCAAITFGAWLVYAPAGFITGGIIAVAAALLLAGR